MENHAPAAIPQIKTHQLKEETLDGFKTPTIYLEVKLLDGTTLDVEIGCESMIASLTRYTMPDEWDIEEKQHVLGSEIVIFLDHEGENCTKKYLPQLVQRPVVVPLFLPVALGRYHRIHPPGRGPGHDFIGVIGFVRQQVFRLDALNQGQRLGAVSHSACGHRQPYRHSVGVHRQVQLAVEPPFVRAMAWLPPRAPALWGWALM